MNNIQSVFSTLGFISENGSRKEKDAALARLRNIGEAKKLFDIATDPTSNHWIIVDDQAERTFTGTDSDAEMSARWLTFLQLIEALKSRKITGDNARAAVEKFIASSSHKAPYKEAAWYMLTLNKHLNIGVAKSAISKVWPDIVSEFAVPLAESLYEQNTGLRLEDVYASITFPLTIEPKLDGVNGSIISSARRSGVFSRGEGNWPVLQRFEKAFKQACANISQRIKQPFEFVLNGEFKASRHSEDPKNWESSWGKTVALCRSGLTPTGFDPARVSAYAHVCIARGDLVYTAYDSYPYSAYASGEFEATYGHRTVPKTRSAITAALVKEMLKVDPTLPIVHVEQHIVHNWDDAKKLHHRFLSEGHEGSMLKPNRPCLLDRSKNIVKWKEYDLRDAVILGVTEGTGKNRGVLAGAFMCWFPDTDECNKVTVRTNALKLWAWQNKDRIAGFKIEASEQIDGAQFKDGVKISAVEASAAGDRVASIRNPVLSRLRVDVPPADSKEVAAACVRFKLPVPTARMSALEFNEIANSLSL